MPYRRRFKKKRFSRKRFSRKRSGFRKKRGSSNDILMLKGRNNVGGEKIGFPGIYFTRLAYETTIDVSGASETAVTEFAPTNLLAPTGSTPYSFKDNLLNIWEQWVCLGYSWRVRCINKDIDAMEVYVLPWTTNTDPTSRDTIRIQKGVKQKICSPAGDGQTQVFLKGYCNMRRLTGMNVVTEQELWGRKTSAPSVLPKFYVLIHNILGLGVRNGYFQLELTGYFKFWSPVLQPSVVPAAIDLNADLLNELGREVRALPMNVDEEKEEDDVVGD